MISNRPPRAWHKKERKMFTCHSLEWSGDRLCWVVLATIEGLLYFRGEPIDIEDVILLRPTGLQDKNGKEIYKGDIVGGYCEGEWITGEVVWLQKWAQFGISCKNGFWLSWGLPENQIEVLGNIYQNPELVEAEISQE